VPSDDVAEFGGWPRPPRVGIGTRLGGRCGSAGRRGSRPHRAAPRRRFLTTGVAAVLLIAGSRHADADVAPGRGRVRMARLPAADPPCPIPRRCLRHGAGRRDGAAAGHPRPCPVQAAAGAAGSWPAGYQSGRCAGCRLCRQHAMQQYQPIPEDLPDCGWRRPPPQHDRRRLARRSPPRVGGDLPGTPYGAHCAGRGRGSHPQAGHHPFADTAAGLVVVAHHDRPDLPDTLKLIDPNTGALPAEIPASRPGRPTCPPT
jgi:hypothetical protein